MLKNLGRHAAFVPYATRDTARVTMLQPIFQPLVDFLVNVFVHEIISSTSFPGSSLLILVERWNVKRLISFIYKIRHGPELEWDFFINHHKIK